MPSLKISLIAGATLGLGMISGSSALAGQSGFCLTGTTSSETARIDCAGRWVPANGTRLGPQYDARDTPRTPHPRYRDGQTQSAPVFSHHDTGSRVYSTHHADTPAAVWTPPSPYTHGAAPVVVARGNQLSAYDGSYDVYVPTRAPAFEPPHQYGPSMSACHGNHTQNTRVVCGDTRARLPVEGCYSLDAQGRSVPAPCPVISEQPVHARTTAHASAYASASASVNVSNSAFFNTLSGGVGGTPNVYYGGGSTIISAGGGGSVLSRAPLIRFGGRKRGGGGGGGHGCNCGGGGMMGMGGGD
jgi:hypothetical protein